MVRGGLEVEMNVLLMGIAICFAALAWAYGEAAEG